MGETGDRERPCPMPTTAPVSATLVGEPARSSRRKSRRAPSRSQGLLVQPGRPNRGNASSATSGIQRTGMASTIATMSTRKDMSRTGREPMKTRPSITELNPGRPREPSGGSGGKPDCRVERGGEQHRIKAVRVGGESLVERDQHTRRSNGPTTCPDIADGEVQRVRRSDSDPPGRCAE